MDTLMKRLGFVRLNRYGLVLTPEGRIMSLRPAVLDAGAGSCIVGWTDDDLAEFELPKWAPSPAPSKAVASRVAISIAEATPAPYVIPAPNPVVEIMTIPVGPPAPVASATQVEEDEWEWEIALARARAAAEESESATRPVVASTPILQPLLPMVATKIEPIESWPKTEPLGVIDYEDYSSSTRDVIRVARGTEPPPIKAIPQTKVIRVPTPPPVKPPVVKQPLAPVVVKPATPSTRKLPTVPMRPLAKPMAIAAAARISAANAATAPTPPTATTPTPAVPTEAPATVIPVPKLGRVNDSQSLAPVRSSSEPRRLAKGTASIASIPHVAPVAKSAPIAKPAAPVAAPPPAATVTPLQPRPPVVATQAPAGRSKLPSIVQRSR